MPQFAISDANWKRFLKDVYRLRRQGVSVPPEIAADMIRARAEALVCSGEEGDLVAAIQAARSQVAAANPDITNVVSENAVLTIYPDPLC